MKKFRGKRFFLLQALILAQKYTFGLKNIAEIHNLFIGL